MLLVPNKSMTCAIVSRDGHMYKHYAPTVMTVLSSTAGLLANLELINNQLFITSPVTRFKNVRPRTTL